MAAVKKYILFIAGIFLTSATTSAQETVFHNPRVTIAGTMYTVNLTLPTEQRVQNIFIKNSTPQLNDSALFTTLDNKTLLCSVKKIDTDKKVLTFVPQEPMSPLTKVTLQRLVATPPAANRTTQPLQGRQITPPTQPQQPRPTMDTEAQIQDILKKFNTDLLPTIIAYKVVKDSTYDQLTLSEFKNLHDIRFTNPKTETQQTPYGSSTITTPVCLDLGQRATIYVPKTGTITQNNFGDVASAVSAGQPYISFDYNGTATKSIINSYSIAAGGLAGLSTLMVDTSPLDRTTLQPLTIEKKSTDEVRADFERMIRAMFGGASVTI